MIRRLIQTSATSHYPRTGRVGGDILYDAIQALGAWVAVIALGFPTPLVSRSTCVSPFCGSYAITLYAVIIIMLGALILYGRTSTSGNITRIGGIVVAVLALWPVMAQWNVVWVMAAAAIVLWLLQLNHFHMRLDTGFYRAEDSDVTRQ
jgi:hypothetical protein